MAADAGGIRAGRAYVELFLQDGLTGKLQQVQRQAQRFGQAIQAVGRQVAMAGLGMVAGFGAALGVFGEMGTGLQQMSERTGVSVESLSTLGFAAEQSGASLEGVEHGLRHMSKAISEAAGGSREARQHLAQLGLAAAQLQGLKPDEAFRLLGSRLAAVPDPARRSALAMEILGREGGRLLPMFGNVGQQIGHLQASLAEAAGGAGPAAAALGKLGLSAAELRQMKPDDAFGKLQQALQGVADPAERSALALQLLGRSSRDLAAVEKQLRDMGIVMSSEDAAAALEFSNSLKALWATVKFGVFQIGAALAPQLKGIIGHMTQAAATVARFIKENRALIVTAAGVAAGIAAAGAAIVGVGAVISGIGAVIGSVVALVGGVLTAVGVAWGAVAAVFGFLITPLGLVVAGIAAAAAAVLYFTGAWRPLVSAGQGALGQLAGSFANIKATALETWGGIKDAFAAGDLGLAAQIAWAGVKVAFLENTVALRQAWIEFTSFLADSWTIAVTAAKVAWILVREAALTAVDALLDGFEAMKPLLKSVWDFFLQAARIATQAALGQVHAILDALARVPGMTKLATQIGRGLDVAAGAHGAALTAADEQIGGLLQPGRGERLAGRGETVADVVGEGADRIEQERVRREQALAESAGAGGKAREQLDTLKELAAAQAAAKKPPPAVATPQELAAKAPGAGPVSGSFNANVLGRLGTDKLADVAANTRATADGVKALGDRIDRLAPTSFV